MYCGLILFFVNWPFFQFRIKLDSYRKHREGQCKALWKQIATIIKSHVTQTDTRRLHFAELKRLDTESAAEIVLNKERINFQEVKYSNFVNLLKKKQFQEEIKNLNQQFENLTLKQTEIIKNLKSTLTEKTDKFFSVRKQFRKKVTKDEKKLIFLTHISNKSIEFLQKIQTKGEQIITLMMTCQKFETDIEKISKWLPHAPSIDLSLDAEEQEEIKRRSSAKSETSAPEEVKKIVISVKSPCSSPKSYEDLIDKEFALMECLEKFWEIFNRVDLDFRGMKQEKKVLLEQNKHIRGMIRAVLEAVALNQTTPASKVPTRAVSKSRGTKSAPLRRILV